MLKVQRILATSMFVCHLVLGFSVLFDVGPLGNSPVWNVLSEIWTTYGPPASFLCIAAFAGVGFFRRGALQISLYLGSVLMLLWSFGLLVIWRTSGVPQLTIVLLINIAVLKCCAAYFWLGYEREKTEKQEQIEAIDRLSHSVAGTINRSRAERGRGHAGDLGAS